MSELQQGSTGKGANTKLFLELAGKGFVQGFAGLHLTPR